MRRFFTRALATGILFGAVLILLSSRPLAAADDTPAFRQANGPVRRRQRRRIGRANR